MSAPELDLRALQEIPDPAARAAARVPPEAAPPGEASPTRAERRQRLFIGLGAALAWVAILVWRFGLRHDLGTFGVLVELALWAVTAATALAAAMHPGKRGISLGVRSLTLMLVAVPFVFLTCALVWSLSAHPIPITWANTTACLLLSSAIGLGPLGLTLVLFRHAFVAAATWRLALLGAVAGMAGTIGCHSHCPIGGFVHVALAHGFPILLGAVVGAVWGATRGRA